MPSDEFLRRYNAGALGDDLALIHWAGLLDIAQKEGFQVELNADCSADMPAWDDYGFHYRNRNGVLRFRYDKAPHRGRITRPASE